MANSVIQTIKDAEIDARSLSEFVSKGHTFTVTRRLAPTIHTLDYYLLVLNKVKDKGDLADIAISDTLDKLEQLEPTVIQRVEDAINNTAVDGGVLADTFVVVDATLNQRQINRGFESIADMLSIANPNNGLRVYVKSYHAGLGKGGGYFVYDSSRSEVDNKGTIINGWIREFTGSVTPLMFGAKGDGVTHDRDAFQDAIDSGASSIYVPSGTYYFEATHYKSNGINITRSDMEIYGDGASSVILGELGSNGRYCTNLLAINRWDGGTPDPADNVKNVTIRGIRFKSQDNREAPKDGVREYVHHMNLHAASNILIDNCSFIGFQGDGIYIGSSNVNGVERHNEHITIQNCLFDGVDNLNRNGISIIDGDNIHIISNRFMRCTYSGQPAAIDIEPDGAKYHIVRNIFILNNSFTKCNGMVGHIGIVLQAGGTTGYTTQPENFVISGNHFDDSNVAVSALNRTKTYERPTQLVISNNTGNPIQFIKTQTGGDPTYWRGIVVSGNVFTLTTMAWFGYFGGDEVHEVSITGNTFNSLNLSSAFRIITGKDILIASNTFSGQKDKAIELSSYDAVYPLERVSIIGNTFINISGANRSVDTSSTVGVPNGVIGNECVYKDNNHSGLHRFAAWRTDDTGSIISNGEKGTIGVSTLPDTFPAGISTATINGAEGLPSGLGGAQGVLITYRNTKTASLEKYIYQEFYHANNTLKEGSFFIRRRLTEANLWTSWSEITN